MSLRPTQAYKMLGSFASTCVSAAVASSAAAIVHVKFACVPSAVPMLAASEEAISVPSTFAMSMRSTESCSQSALSASLASSASSCVRMRETAAHLLNRLSFSASIIGSACSDAAVILANARSIRSVSSDFARVSICRENGTNAIAIPISINTASRGTNHFRKNRTISNNRLSRRLCYPAHPAHRQIGASCSLMDSLRSYYVEGMMESRKFAL